MVRISKTVFVQGCKGTAALFFPWRLQSKPEVEAPGGFAKIKRGLQLHRMATHCEPYHRLGTDRAEEKTVFVFADEAVPDTVRGHRLASQLYLAEWSSISREEKPKR